MFVKNDFDNLIYDSENKECSIEICMSQGELYAFIVALDIGYPEHRFKEPYKKRYWGKYTWNNEKESIYNILNNGGKWPRLHDKKIIM